MFLSAGSQRIGFGHNPWGHMTGPVPQGTWRESGASARICLEWPATEAGAFFLDFRKEKVIMHFPLVEAIFLATRELVKM